MKYTLLCISELAELREISLEQRLKCWLKPEWWMRTQEGNWLPWGEALMKELWRRYRSAQAAVRTDHRRGGGWNPECMFSQFWRLDVQGLGANSQGWVLLRFLSLAWRLSPSCCLFTRSYSGLPSFFSSYKNTSHVGLVSHPNSLFLTLSPLQRPYHLACLHSVVLRTGTST